ncbi:MAG: sigma-70 family RNA polymerase sigma factor [Pirellulales bacterium]
MQRTVEELVEAAGRGDIASFGLLYERYFRLAVSVTRARSADSHLAEDAAQEAFGIAFRTINKLRDRRRFPQWLTTICRRTASRLSNNRPIHETLHEAPESDRDSVDQGLRDHVQEALSRLDASAREIVVLHYFGKLTYEEIGEALQLSVPSIHGRLQRARAKLAQLLDTYSNHGD